MPLLSFMLLKSLKQNKRLVPGFNSTLIEAFQCCVSKDSKGIVQIIDEKDPQLGSHTHFVTNICSGACSDWELRIAWEGVPSLGVPPNSEVYAPTSLFFSSINSPTVHLKTKRIAGGKPSTSGLLNSSIAVNYWSINMFYCIFFFLAVLEFELSCAF